MSAHEYLQSLRKADSRRSAAWEAALCRLAFALGILAFLALAVAGRGL